jgi:hypothetical protein
MNEGEYFVMRGPRNGKEKWGVYRHLGGQDILIASYRSKAHAEILASYKKLIRSEESKNP